MTQRGDLHEKSFHWSFLTQHTQLRWTIKQVVPKHPEHHRQGETSLPPSGEVNSWGNLLLIYDSHTIGEPYDWRTWLQTPLLKGELYKNSRISTSSGGHIGIETEKNAAAKLPTASSD